MPLAPRLFRPLALSNCPLTIGYWDTQSVRVRHASLASLSGWRSLGKSEEQALSMRSDYRVTVVNAFLPSSENNPQNVPLIFPKFLYGTILLIQPAIPKIWQMCFVHSGPYRSMHQKWHSCKTSYLSSFETPLCCLQLTFSPLDRATPANWRKEEPAWLQVLAPFYTSMS